MGQVMGAFMLWGYIFLKTPSKMFGGPPTSSGYVPIYSDNGFQFYVLSLVVYLALHLPYPSLSSDIYENMPYLLGSLNVFALTFCVLLYVRGKYAPQNPEKEDSYPLVYEFYRGMEVHPRMLGVDVKQWTNCRVGMMAWQILIVAFLIAGRDRNGGVFNVGHIVNVVLQTIYIGKFFWWETGYFNTLDITLDRAGYYICWGCLVWVPAFYTYSSYFLVAQPSLLSTQAAIGVAFLGLACVLMNYRVDYEKQLFRTTEGRCQLWGRDVVYMDVVDQSRTPAKKSKLLLSGCWGVVRHLNYVFEISAAFSWSLPNIGHGIWPFSYVIFLTCLLVHRTFRDEEKCAKKYGRYWPEYCRQVPYRMIPYIF